MVAAEARAEAYAHALLNPPPNPDGTPGIPIALPTSPAANRLDALLDGGLSAVAGLSKRGIATSEKLRLSKASGAAVSEIASQSASVLSATTQTIASLRTIIDADPFSPPDLALQNQGRYRYGGGG